MASDKTPGLPAEESEQRLLAFVRTELLGPDATIDRDDELLSGTLLDSIGVVRLASFVEEAFELKMQPRDLVVENFRSIAVLAEYVHRRGGSSH